jgi:uncharacterized protein YydD (DUF2326 family)
VKLSRLYCNRPELFPPIVFSGDLSVIFARVHDYKEKGKDVHNLGKTFLTTVIDFGLLAEIDGEHPFRKHSSRFGALTFFLEIATIDEKYVTVRRPVTGRASIAIKIEEDSQDLSHLPIDAWDHKKLAVKTADEILNKHLGLTTLQPYDYRKGLGYFLRRQNDYDDIFRISKFGRGRDLDWKPFMALLLGFDWRLVRQKYELDDEIKSVEGEIALLEREAGVSSGELDEVRGRINILNERLRMRREELSGFEFYEADLALSRELVGEIEKEIGAFNEKRYRWLSQIEEVETALEDKVAFDPDRVAQLYEEARASFAEPLKRSLEEVMLFNRKLSEAREERLQIHRKRLSLLVEKANESLRELDTRRARALDALKSAETLERFRRLHENLLREEEALISLQGQARQLDAISLRRRDLRNLEIERTRMRSEIEAMVSQPPKLYEVVRSNFARIVEHILDVSAIISVRVNAHGNLEFEHTIAKDSLAKMKTSEAEGFSYQKILCVCFDLALLCSYSDMPFYKFVYHDGVFEALDHRRKNRMIAEVRRLIDDHGLQYILTVIDSDLPRDEQDQKLYFQPEEVVRELSDSGDSGRLFPGPVF